MTITAPIIVTVVAIILIWQLEGMSDWSIEAVSHFIELVSDSTPTKALVHKITEDNCVVISIFAP